MGLTSLAANVIDPFGILRNLVLRPILDVTSVAFVHYKEKTSEGVSSARDVAVKLTIIAVAAAIITWASVFMYIAFYYTYMPAIAHVRPVYMQFTISSDEPKVSTFPKAHVSLTKRQQLLMVGQPYRILVHIDMPESPQNQDLGMFMVCAEMRDELTNLRDHSCRSAMLHYKSPLVRAITTWVFSPLYVFGVQEEKQLIPVELFTNFEDERNYPVTDVYLEIQSKKIQFYAVTLQITAHFSGLRYIMFHWPILSATVGISTNLFFIMIVSILSWYHWGDAVWIEDAKEKLKKRAQYKRQLETDFSTSLDDDQDLLDNDDDIIAADDDEDEQTFSNKSDDDIEDIFPERSQQTSSGTGTKGTL